MIYWQANQITQTKTKLMQVTPTISQRKSAKMTQRIKNVKQVKFSSLNLPISKLTRRKRAVSAKVHLEK